MKTTEAARGAASSVFSLQNEKPYFFSRTLLMANIR
jgi:hypothetical protein